MKMPKGRMNTGRREAYETLHSLGIRGKQERCEDVVKGLQNFRN